MMEPQPFVNEQDAEEKFVDPSAQRVEIDFRLPAFYVGLLSREVLAAANGATVVDGLVEIEAQGILFLV